MELVKNYVPMFYDKFLRPGAVYWFNRKQNGMLALDINYFTFDFNVIGVDFGTPYGTAVNGVTQYNTDAYYIRMVE